MHTDTSSVI